MALSRGLARPIVSRGVIRATARGLDMILAGVGTGMQFTSGGNSGGTNRSTTVRFPCRSKIPIRRFMPLIPVFTCLGSNPIIDTLYSGSQAQLFFQMGIEYPFTNALTGLSVRIPCTFKGLNYAAYDNATWDASSGFIKGDMIDLGFTIPANTDFGIVFTRELPAGTWSNNLPYQYNVSSFIDRKIGATSSTSSQIAALGGASDVALAATSFTAVTAAQAGASTGFGPACLLVESPAGTKTVAIVGDSLGNGVGEGTDATDATGDCLGNAQMLQGYLARGVFAAGYNYVNLSKGSDGNKFLVTPANWKYRRELLQLLHAGSGRDLRIINGNGHNDVSATITISAKTNGNTYAAGDAVLGTGLYVCLVGGVSGSVSLTSTTVGALIADGAVTWLCLGTLPGTSGPRGHSLVFGQELNVNAQIGAVAPNAKIITTKVTPDSTSTDSWATNANQTVTTNWGDATTRRGMANANKDNATLLAALRASAVIDVNAIVEDGANSSKWVSGSAKKYTSDGTHPNTNGAKDGATAPSIPTALAI